jgi:transcriptional regulator with XRE-family HTH domain
MPTFVACTMCGFWKERVPVDAEVEKIAERIHRFRTAEGLTLQELGDRAGVSPSTIHKIENGQTIPTISVLLKVANGLRRPATELFEGPTEEVVFRHLRPGEATSFRMRRGGVRVDRIAGAVPKARVDLWRLVLDPGAGVGLDQRLSYEGEVIICVESGTLDVTVEGECSKLATGDTLHFLTHHDHCWQNTGDTTATALFFGRLKGAITGRADP